MAAILTLTDAALGKAVETDDHVPEGVRHTLLAESGLNDGIALPFIIFAGCVAVGFQHELGQENWIVFAGQQVGLDILSGAAVGLVSGLLLKRAISAKVIDEKHSGIFALLVVPMAWLLPHTIGGNPFLPLHRLRCWSLRFCMVPVPIGPVGFV